MGGRVQAGEVLDGKYAVERIIGQGGTGYVVAAQHLILRRRVALKFLRPELAAQPELGQRFLREAQAAAQMKGDHVARVMDADTLGTGEPYLVMEFLEGEDMAALVQRGGPLSVSDATNYLLQACEAVSEAHALKIVHRDLKPGNLFLAQGPGGKPYVKVLDFGLSKVLALEGLQSLTDSNHVVGSPHFMSPEQIRTPRDVDERTDIWSLGATLFSMLTGHVPFDGRSMIEVCGALLCGPAPRVRRFRDDVPAELEEVVLRCLRVDPADRYESVAALSRALAPFAGEASHPGLEAIESAPDSIDAEAPMTASHAGVPRGDMLASGRLAVVIGVIALVGLAMVWGLGRLATHGGPRLPPIAEAPPRAMTALGDTPTPVPSAPPDSDLTPDSRASAPIHDAADASALRKVPFPVGERAPRGVAAPSSAAGRASLAPPTGSDGTSPAPPGRGQNLDGTSPAPPGRGQNLESTSPAPPGRGQSVCADPFYIDGQGIKTFRPGCL